MYKYLIIFFFLYSCKQSSLESDTSALWGEPFAGDAVNKSTSLKVIICGEGAIAGKADGCYCLKPGESTHDWGWSRIDIDWAIVGGLACKISTGEYVIDNQRDYCPADEWVKPPENLSEHLKKPLCDDNN